MAEEQVRGTHLFVPDPRNESVLIDVNGEHFPRAEARVSVFDSGFMLGDGVWEGIRLHGGRLAFLDRHLDRLWRGAKAIALDIGIARQELERRLYAVLDANGMTGEGAHLRLMVTRGVRSTPYQDPRVVVGAATIVIIPEWKAPALDTATRMLELFTVHVRRGYPDVQDPMLNSHSKLNCITACIPAAQAGADEGLMLDPHGFVATCNSTHFFIVTGGEVWTSSGDYCLDGITRGVVIEIARRRDDGARTQFFADACLWRERGILHRHFRGCCAGGERRWARARDRARSCGRAAPEVIPRADRRGRRREGEAVTIRIAMWSGPRNISTAMLRSFGSRADCAVTDEPFYGAFLKDSGEPHPLATETIASMDCDWQSVLHTMSGHAPPVADPARILKQLCGALGIAWDPAMLAWQRGPHPEDGAWGAHWYDKVNASTGFGKPAGPLPALTGEARAVAEACRADYEALLAQALA